MNTTAICDKYSYYSRHFDIVCEFNEDRVKPMYRFNVHSNSTKQIIDTSEWIDTDLNTELQRIKDKHYLNGTK